MSTIENRLFTLVYFFEKTLFSFLWSAQLLPAATARSARAAFAGVRSSQPTLAAGSRGSGSSSSSAPFWWNGKQTQRQKFPPPLFPPSPFFPPRPLFSVKYGAKVCCSNPWRVSFSLPLSSWVDEQLPRPVSLSVSELMAALLGLSRKIESFICFKLGLLDTNKKLLWHDRGVI